MYVLEILPLARNVPVGTLSYRSRERAELGTLVSVPLRKQQVRGVVVACVPVSEAKSVLKRASFALKSSGGAAAEGALPLAVMQAAEEVAAYHAAPLGSILHALLSEALPAVVPAASAGPGARTVCVEAPYTERVTAYAKLIEEEAAAGRSAMLVVPTGVELERLSADLKHLNPIAVSGTVTGKKRAAALEKAAEATLVIATPSFSWIPLRAPGAFIVERASAGGYRMQERPHLDFRIALASLSRARDVAFVCGDFPLPIEWRANPALPLSNPPQAGARIIDAAKERADGEKDAPFLAVSPHILKELGKATANGGRAAVLAVRKGYAPTVICRDCGSAVRDAEGRALSFSAAGGKRIFRSTDGKTVEDARVLCDKCGGWNLLPLGIGIERVAEEIAIALPDSKVVMLDAAALRTPALVKKARKAVEAPGTIIIGTEVMLPLLDPDEPLAYAAIASADSLLALPFWRARERFVHAGITLLDRAKRVTVATRRADDAAVLMLANPEDASYFAEEFAMRAVLGYPPSGHLLVFHAEASASKAAEAARLIEQALGEIKSTRLPDRPVRTRVRISIVAKVSNASWPDSSLSARIASLPPWISVAIDTESLW